MGVSASDTITATFKWVDDDGNPVIPGPKCVMVREQARAEYNATNGDDSLSNPIADNAFGDPIESFDNPHATVNQLAYIDISGVPAADADNFISHYSVYDGSSGTIVLPARTLSASVDDTVSPTSEYGSDVWAGVYYSAGAYPITLDLGGTTLDSSRNHNILIGQHCSASLTGFPSDCTVSYQWSVSGPTFQYWSADTPAHDNVSYNAEASYYVDGSGPLTNPTASWCWHEIGNNTSKSETVSCTATVTPPTGAGSAFTVTASKPVTVWLPHWTCSGTGNYMRVYNISTTGGSDYVLGAGGSSTNLGMNWNATISTPNSSLFGDGIVEIVQLVVPDRSITARKLGITSTYNWTLNGQEGLDTTYPYGWLSEAPNYEANDNPFMGLTAYDALSATEDDQFMDYLMYFPPGSLQCVPLAHFVWSTNGSAIIPSTGNWADYATQHGGSDVAGSVTPSGADNFLQSNTFPMWTQIVAAANGSFIISF